MCMNATHTDKLSSINENPFTSTFERLLKLCVLLCVHQGLISANLLKKQVFESSSLSSCTLQEKIIILATSTCDEPLLSIEGVDINFSVERQFCEAW